MGREYQESERIKGIAEGLIERHHRHLGPARIAYVMKGRDREDNLAPPKEPREGKQRRVTRARLVPQLYRLLTGYDFIIEVDQILWDMLELGQQEAVIDHELCHCARDEKGWYLRDHDVQEFREILERHGFYHPKLEQFVSIGHQLKLTFEPRAAVNE